MKQTIEAMKEGIEKLLDESVEDIEGAMLQAEAVAEGDEKPKVKVTAAATITRTGTIDELDIKLTFVKEKVKRSTHYSVSNQEELFDATGHHPSELAGRRQE